MKKIILTILVTILVMSITATAGMLIPANDKAIEHSPVIGENGDLERVDFIHYAKSVSPAKAPATICYKLLGVKWTTLPVSYVINPTSSGLDEGFVTTAVSTSAETWDLATSKELFADTYDIDYTAKYGVQNFENAIAFGDYPQDGVIAVTSIWYTRVGKRIVEFDILFDTDFTWGDADPNNDGIADNSMMDLQNIATHELGHGAGLADIYTSTCTAVTMYGYSNYGDITKRDLAPPDITGLQKMYGT